MFKSVKKIFVKKISEIKSFFVGLPKTTLTFSKNFVLGTKNFVLSAPKYFKNTVISTRDKILNFPKNTVIYLKKVRNYRPKDWLNALLDNAILISLLALILYIVIVNPNFLSWNTFSSILTQSSTRLIIALGTGTIIVARGTDLSAGRAVGLTALIAATFSQDIAYNSAFVRDILGQNPVVIIIITMLIGAFVGLINGIIVAKLNVTPFIATLGTMLIIYGLNIYLAEQIANSQPIGQFADEYTKLASEGWSIGDFEITYLTMISLGLAFFMWMLWTKTPFGRSLFAVGGNPKAAAVSGISVTFVLISTYVIGGVLYGIGGALEAWRVGSVTSSTGNMYELDAIAACIVGGLSFEGGRGKIKGIILGVLIFQTITYGFAFIGFSTYVIYIVKGSIIVGAVAFDMIKNKVRV